MPLLIRLFHASTHRLTQIRVCHCSQNANSRVPMAGDGGTGGNTSHSPLPCRKNTMLNCPVGTRPSRRTKRTPAMPKRPVSVTRAGTDLVGASHLSTSALREMAWLFISPSSICPLPPPKLMYRWLATVSRVPSSIEIRGTLNERSNCFRAIGKFLIQAACLLSLGVARAPGRHWLRRSRDQSLRFSSHALKPASTEMTDFAHVEYSSPALPSLSYMPRHIAFSRMAAPPSPSGSFDAAR